MRTLLFDLAGTGPLLMHNAAAMQIVGDSAVLNRKKIPSPTEEAEAGLYRCPDGCLYFPAVGVRNAMLSGAKGSRIDKISAVTVLSGVIALVEEQFPLVDDLEQPIRQYAIDARRVVVQKAGIIRHRPRIEPPWKLHCAFGFDDEVMRNHIPAQQALERAGRIIGIGDYRPERKGWFGRFVVENCRLV